MRRLATRIPISPLERRARRRRWLTLSGALGLSVVAGGLLIAGPLRQQRAADRRCAEIEQRVASLQAISVHAEDLMDTDGRLLAAAREDLDRVLPPERSAERWRETLAAHATRHGLDEVELLVEEPLAVRATEADMSDPYDEAAAGGDVGVAAVEGFRFRVLGSAPVRRALAFVDGLAELEPVVRPVRLALSRREEPFDTVGLDLSVVCYWSEGEEEGP